MTIPLIESLKVSLRFDVLTRAAALGAGNKESYLEENR